MGGMEKSTVYLTMEQKAALAKAAAAQGRSEARLIRDGVDVVTGGRRVAEASGALGTHTQEPPDADVAVAAGRSRWLTRDAFVRSVVRDQADPALARELRELAPDTTDDTPSP
jgi:hypothetical protein